MPYTKQQIIERKKNSGYDYSLLSDTKKYITRDIIDVVCSKHGKFSILLSSHLLPTSICPECKNPSRKPTINKKFISDEGTKKYGTLYDYSEIPENTLFLKSDIINIICSKHGKFKQSIINHLNNGFGCRECSLEETREINKKLFLVEAMKKHNNFYDYSEINYINNKTKIDILCPKHGIFNQLPGNHLMGQGCPLCGNEKIKEKLQKSFKEFSDSANKIHNDFYKYKTYFGMENDIEIECLKHGNFIVKAKDHIYKNKGCPKCFEENGKNFLTNESFLEKANLVHGNKYDYSKHNYQESGGSTGKGIFICPEHGEFLQLNYAHLSGRGCSQCIDKTNISLGEQELVDWIKTKINNIETNNRTILSNNKELDIYIDEIKLAIEYNGLFFHSDSMKNNNYHLNKTNECKDKGINLIHVFEDEWLNKKEIVKSRLLSILNLSENKIFARKCEIREVPNSEKIRFLKENHLQGNVNSKINIGLYNDNKLVSLMTFGNLRKFLGSEQKENSYELLRFCNLLNHNVIGGASKLLKYFEKNYNPKFILSYADRRWSTGNLYNKLNFVFVKETQPNYFYLNYSKEKIRINRATYNKKILIEKYNCPKNTTEKEFTKKVLKLDRIYDCGSLVYHKNYND